MTADEVRAFAERHIEHWQARDAAAIAADHAPDGVVESPSAGTHQGHEAIRKALQKVVRLIPGHAVPDGADRGRHGCGGHCPHGPVNAVRPVASRSIFQSPATRGLDISASHENLLQTSRCHP